MEQILQQWQARVRQASEQGLALQIRGGGSKDWYGQQLAGEVFDTRAWRGIIAYEPSELVITARCGTPLAELEQVLAEQKQLLAFEPPHFSPSAAQHDSTQLATVGGMFAAGLSGPRRASHGALRDYVLGASLLDGRGEILHFGGQVMKNVAGYDVSRLLAGSLGSLGIVLQVSLKVVPMPQFEQSVRFEMSAAEALAQLQRWQGMPISASAWHAGQLSLRLSGSEAVLAAARKKIGGASLAHAESFWHNLREQKADFFIQAARAAQLGYSLWRFSVPPQASLSGIAAPALLEWQGAQRWYLLEDAADRQAQAQDLRRLATSLGGHATLFRAANKSVGVFSPLAASVQRVQQALQQSFDPAGIFNPGRMYLPGQST